MSEDRLRPAATAAIASLQRLTDLFRERRLELARSVGLSESQWQLLEEIAGEGFMPSMFARSRDRAPASVSRSLRQLLDRELISSAISTDDARQRVYHLTASGRRLLARMNRNRERAIEEIWGSFSNAELERFTRFATTLGEGLEQYRAKRS